ncbi:hypothetical protein [Synechococcus sp. FACHB-909]|uniref:hypothetical protein n=1 Tax=Synechococcus sp. FACHB-909 TaxID=2692863 RepID=UPI0018F04BA6|nr:hypothetical protein [Synechococcus sp. FACHB-909]
MDAAFHQASPLELCRVAREVRVLSLLELGWATSPHRAAAVEMLRIQRDDG